MSTSVTVSLGDRSYPVLLDAGGPDGLGVALRERSSAKRVALVTDEVVGPLWAESTERSLRAAGFEVARIVLPAGEAHKTVATWADAVDRILRAGVDRRTPVVALGGGVVGDIAGFAAASLLRGLPFVQVPTTLLAMVDSSVGGKTGVDHPLGKNLIGAFHQPMLVFAPLATLATLPAREVRAGLGEVVKTAVLGDAELLERLERDAEALREGRPDALAPVIARCVAIKAEVVAADEREAGLRAILNYGHTVGHGLEAAAAFSGLLHGEAVGIGMLAETRWAVGAGVCEDTGLPDRILALLGRLGLPTAAPELPPDAVLAAMRVDKKATEGMLTVPVPIRPGRMTRIDVPFDSLPELLAHL